MMIICFTFRVHEIKMYLFIYPFINANGVRAPKMFKDLPTLMLIGEMLAFVS